MAGDGRTIPQAKADDNEDVSWALSTADAMWSRGGLADAIKWVRRAAEAASDAEADIRALELAKAAADLNSHIGALGGSGSKPPNSVAVPPGPPPLSHRPPGGTSGIGVSTSAPPASMRRASNIPQAQSPPPSRFPAPAPSRPAPSRTNAPAPGPAAGRRIEPQRAAQSAPPPAKSSRPRSPGQMNKGAPPPIEAPADLDTPDDTAQVAVPVGPTRASRRPPPPRPPEPTPPHPFDPTFDPTNTDEHRSRSEPRQASVAEIDAWPTQAVSGDESTEGGLASLVAALPPMRQREPSRAPMDTALLATQAVRVVVWRTADGVRVAPAGTVVSAIACDAVLVALDPTADLSAWLTNKP